MFAATQQAGLDPEDKDNGSDEDSEGDTTATSQSMEYEVGESADDIDTAQVTHVCCT